MRNWAIGIAVVLAAGLSAWLLGADEGHAPSEPASDTELRSTDDTEPLEGPELQPAERHVAPAAHPPTKATSTEPSEAAPTKPSARTRMVTYRGRVVDADAEPAQSAHVRITNAAGDAFEATTNAKGEFSVSLPAGHYVVAVTSASGEVRRSPRQIDGGPHTEVIRVTEGPTLRLKLTQGSEPLANTKVAITQYSSTTKQTHAITDAASDVAGLVQVENLPKGHYTLGIQVTPSTAISVRHDHHSGHTYPIGFPANVTVEGQVVDERGAGVAGADTTIRAGYGAPGRSLEATTKTDSSGMFSIQAPKSMVFSWYVDLIVKAEGYERWSAMFANPKELRNERKAQLQPLRRALVGTPGQTTRIALRRQTEPFFSGRIVDEDGKPVPNLEITWKPVRTGSGKLVSATTDGQGRYAIQDMLPGEYDPSIPPGAVLVRHRRITVSANKPVRDLDLVVSSHVVLSGRVVLPNGTPVVGARVWRTPRRGIRRDPDVPTPHDVLTTDQGAFVFLGSKRVSSEVAVHARWGDLRAAPVKATFGKKKSIRVVLEPAVHLRLDFRDRAGHPLRPLSVTFVPDGEPIGRSNWARTTDHDGRLEQIVLPAMWRLRVRSKSLPEEHVEVVDLRGKSGHVTHEVQVDTGLAIEGRIVTDTGVGIVAKVELRLHRQSAAKQKIESGRDGQFRISGLSAGRTYWIVATAPGYRWTAQGPIEPGTRGLDVTMAPAR